MSRSTLGHSCDGAGTSPISLLTNSVKTCPDRFQLNRKGDLNRVFFLFVS